MFPSTWTFDIGPAHVQTRIRAFRSGNWISDEWWPGDATLVPYLTATVACWDVSPD